MLLRGCTVLDIFKVVTTQIKKVNCVQQARQFFSVLCKDGGNNILKECNILVQV